MNASVHSPRFARIVGAQQAETDHERGGQSRHCGGGQGTLGQGESGRQIVAVNRGRDSLLPASGAEN